MDSQATNLAESSSRMQDAAANESTLTRAHNFGSLGRFESQPDLAVSLKKQHQKMFVEYTADEIMMSPSKKAITVPHEETKIEDLAEEKRTEDPSMDN